VGGERENKIMNYLIFSGREDKDMNDFIIKLKKTFTVNRIDYNRKHLITISYLKEIIVNFYDGLVDITNWNTVGQQFNIQLRPALIIRFKSEI